MKVAADAAYPAGARAMVGFNYRRVPALALARRSSRRAGSARSGTCGPSTCRTGSPSPDAPMTWRMQAERAGSGALGDLGAHIVDLARYLTGDEITGVSAISATFMAERPYADGSGTGRVTVDDAVVFTARLASGALASFEATRYAAGRKIGLRIELNGTAGSLAFDLERLNGLSSSLCRAGADAAGAATPARPGRVPPRPGHGGGPPVPGRLVAARAHARLGAHVHAPGRRPADGDRGRRAAAAVVRRRPGGAAGPGRCARAPRGNSWESVDKPPAPRRQPGSRAQRQHGRSKGGPLWHGLSPCSPASGRTCRSRKSADWPARGDTTAWRSPAGATTSRSTGRCARTATWPAGTRCWRSTA